MGALPVIEHWEYVTRSPAETVALGRALGELARGRDVLALSGTLGAGKTQLVKGIALGLGVPHDEPVVSPTFVLVREYAGRLHLFHLDAYRLSGAGELQALGFEEMMDTANAVCAVEWADRVAPAIPAEACWIEMQWVDEQTRAVRVSWVDAERLERLAERFGGRPSPARPSAPTELSADC